MIRIMSFSSSSAGSTAITSSVLPMLVPLSDPFLQFSPPQSLLTECIGLIKELFWETKPVLCTGPVLSHHQRRPSALVANQIVMPAHPKPGVSAAKQRPR